MPDPIPPTEPVPLDEQVEVLEPPGLPPPLAPDTLLTAPETTTWRIRILRASDPQYHYYDAVTPDDQPVWLTAAYDETAAARLWHLAHVLDGLDSPMFPRLLACFAHDGVTYLATYPLPQAPTFADLLASGAPALPQVLSVLTQVAFALTRLHAHGWAHLGLRPVEIVLSKPITLLDLNYATRLGDRPEMAFYHSGYSAPELLTTDPIDARADVYAVGALLYHALTGQPIADTGAELSTWLPPTPVAGVPQILARCLGQRETRYTTMAALHQDLLRLARRCAPTLHYAVAAATSIGLEATRTTNQDAYVTLTGSLETEHGTQYWAVLCVADGMGGMAAGDVASATAVRAILTEAAAAVATPPGLVPGDLAARLHQWVHTANAQVCAALEAQQARGGTTLVCACVVERHLAVAHVGDSRLYLLRQDAVQALTRDHSLAMALVQQGQLTLEEVRQHPDRNQVTRSLGDRCSLPDYFVETCTVEVQPGDIVLLCSDGLWEPVLEHEMRHIIQEHAPDLSAAAQALLHQALQRGGPDNATVVLLRIDAIVLFSEGTTHAQFDLQTPPHQPAGPDPGDAKTLCHAEDDSPA